MIQIGRIARHRLGDDLVANWYLLILVRIQYADLGDGRDWNWKKMKKMPVAK